MSSDDVPVEIALRKQPLSIQPRRIPSLLKLLIIPLNILSAVILQWAKVRQHFVAHSIRGKCTRTSSSYHAAIRTSTPQALQRSSSPPPSSLLAHICPSRGAHRQLLQSIPYQPFLPFHSGSKLTRITGHLFLADSQAKDVLSLVLGCAEVNQ